MKRPIAVITSAAVVLAIAGCATAGDNPRSGARSDQLSHAEIQSLDVSTIFDVIQQLRPAWLLTRATNEGLHGEGGIAVYIDGARFGSVQSLRQIPRDQVESIRYLNARRVNDEFTRVSAAGVTGAIMISTRRSGRDPASSP
jgi:hypothetical protein